MGSLAGWRHCPRCGARAEPGPGRFDCPACGYTHYAAANAAVCALVEDGAGRVLLARRAGEPDRGKWDLPGGFLEEWEDPLDGLRRELREETALEIEPTGFLLAYVDRYGDVGAALGLVWMARATAGEPTPDDDVAELRWFAPEALPPDGELAFTRLGSVLRAWRDASTGAAR